MRGDYALLDRVADLRMTPRVRLALWSGVPLVVLLLPVWSSTYSASYQTCQIERAQNEGASDKANFGKKIAYFFVCEGVTLDDNADLLTALATLAVAGFTLTLWLTSGEQARLTREAIDLSRAEYIATHRPRIRVRWVGGPYNGPNDLCRFEVAIVNVGEGPALVTDCWIGTGIVDNQGCTTWPIDIDDSEPTYDIALKPGEIHKFERLTKAPIPERAWERMREFTSERLVLEGRFTYRDDAGLERTTSFIRGQGLDDAGFGIFKPRADQEYED